jgi:nitrous oxidase accessory protein
MRPALPSLALLVALTGCARVEASSQPLPAPAPWRVERPAACDSVPPGELGEKLAAARPGAVLCLEPGRHPGPVVVPGGVTVWGPRGATVHAQGAGSVITLAGAGARVLGLGVDGTGGRYDREDAAIAVRADDAVVSGVHIQNAVFGILVNQARRASITDNEIVGQRDVALGMRGDAIRLWETSHSLIARNQLRDGRDLVVWYSPHNVFTDNVATGGRYGTHFMHASDNVVRRGRFVGNVVGVFVMYSHRITIEDSTLLDCSTAGGMGVGVKDSGDVVIRRNTFVHDTSAIYLDNSPGQLDERDVIEHNRFQLNDAALVFRGIVRGNEVRLNDFQSNRDTVLVEGGGNAREALFAGNRFDDYAGYDFDTDGVGDVPHEVRSLSGQLASAHRELVFFRGTAALGVVEALGRLVPLFAPKTLFVDGTPRLVDATAGEERHAH